MKSIYLIVVLLALSTMLCSMIINVPDDYPTIQQAIDAAADTDTVLVAEGTYFENIDFNGMNITVASLFLTTQDTTYISQTIIDGNQNDCVVRFVSGETMDAVLTGFTITNGTNDEGGGILISNSSPTLVGNVIAGNSSELRGGGVLITGDSSPVFLNNIICYNTSDSYMAGLAFFSCSATSHGTVENCQIYGNTTIVSAAGLAVYAANADVINCIISDNHAGSIGGGVNVLSNADANIINCTISGNTAENGGGIAFAGSDIIIINTIVEGNSATQGNGVYFAQSVNVDISFSDFYNGTENFGGNVPTGLGVITGFNLYGTPCDDFFNIFEDPLFAGTVEHPFSLLEDSPCIDSGIQDTTGLNLPLFDIVGNDRIVDGRGDGFAFIDMGAYELPEPNGSDENTIEQTKNYLHQNYPNPFNPTTIISYQLPENSKVELAIYNLKGQKVKQLVSDQLSAGQHSVVWDGKDNNNKSVSSGIYFYKLKSGNFETTKKMILIK